LFSFSLPVNIHCRVIWIDVLSETSNI
jgi:hypothetical protein